MFKHPNGHECITLTLNIAVVIFNISDLLVISFRLSPFLSVMKLLARYIVGRYTDSIVQRHMTT